VHSPVAPGLTLLPSAAAEAKRARVAEALPGSESTEGGSPLAEREAEVEARRDNSPGPFVELTETLPLVPQGRRVVHKRKALEVDSSKYEYATLLNCQISVLLRANSIHLQSTCFSGAWARRDGNRSISFCDMSGSISFCDRSGSVSFYHRSGDHCYGGHRVTSWCDPTASNEYRATGFEGEEGCHEEVYAVSLHLVA
jgi:hypothetical protein